MFIESVQYRAINITRAHIKGQETRKWPRSLYSHYLNHYTICRGTHLKGPKIIINVTLKYSCDDSVVVVVVRGDLISYSSQTVYVCNANISTPIQVSSPVQYDKRCQMYSGQAADSAFAYQRKSQNFFNLDLLNAAWSSLSHWSTGIGAENIQEKSLKWENIHWKWMGLVCSVQSVSFSFFFLLKSKCRQIGTK